MLFYWTMSWGEKSEEKEEKKEEKEEKIWRRRRRRKKRTYSVSISRTARTMIVILSSLRLGKRASPFVDTWNSFWGETTKFILIDWTWSRSGNKHFSQSLLSIANAGMAGEGNVVQKLLEFHEFRAFQGNWHFPRGNEQRRRRGIFVELGEGNR